MKRELTVSEIEACAHAAHEANRAYCRMLGDYSHATWDSAPEWQKASARAGVLNIARNNITTPEQSHEGWMNHKLANGWRYGPVKDADKREHPCLVPWNELPAEQQVKDILFTTVVRGMIDTFWRQAT